MENASNTKAKVKIKVEPGTIGTRVDDIDSTMDLRFSKPIDEAMLALFETIQDTKLSPADALREECMTRVSQTLKRAQGSLANKDRQALDELAQDLSHCALKIGAAQMLSSAIEIQGLARIGEFTLASELLGRMEVELVQVRSHYK